MRCLAGIVGIFSSAMSERGSHPSARYASIKGTRKRRRLLVFLLWGNQKEVETTGPTRFLVAIRSSYNIQVYEERSGLSAANVSLRKSKAKQQHTI